MARSWYYSETGSKTYFGPQSDLKDKVLSFNKTQSRIVTDLLTGHNTQRIRLHLMGLTNTPLCRRSAAEEEISVHILCECEALASDMQTWAPFSWTQRILRV
jgi:hypothetical protein